MAVTGIKLWEIPERLTEPMLFSILSNLSEVEEEIAKPGAMILLEGMTELLKAASGKK